MEIISAIEALGALAQESRLKVFRLLVRQGPAGMAAGDIARALSVPNNTMSSHLATLARAGLIGSRKESRSVLYAVISKARARCSRSCWRIAAAAVATSARRDHRHPQRGALFIGSGGEKRREETMAIHKQQEPLNVLFLCTGNTARSIMAEAILNRLGVGKFKAYSAGSYPKGEVNPHALTVLRKSKFDVSKLRSKSWDEFAEPEVPELDFVFTVCDDAAKEVCPVWPGQPMTAHWGLPDPAKAEGTEAEQALAFADCFRMLYQRISIFVSLPIDRLSKLSLQKHLDEIGQTKDAPAKESA